LVYGIGSNKDGKLGFPPVQLKINKPQLIEMSTQIVKVACGWGHSLALDIYGNVYSWGYGKLGALGLGNFENSSKPRKIVGFNNKIKEIYCGSQHSGFITIDNKAYTCGANIKGQLGIGSRANKCEPSEIYGIEQEIQSLSLGVTHTLILTENGEVYSVGGNNFGQLGLGNKQTMEIPQKITSLSKIVKIACGQHSAALSKSGELFLWGTGTFGSYLTPHLVSSLDAQVSNIWVGGCFGIASDELGYLWAWGTNTSGELGVGDYEPRSAPTRIMENLDARISNIYCGSCFVYAIEEKEAIKISTLKISENVLHQQNIDLSNKIPGQIVGKTFRSAKSGKNTQRSIHENNYLETADNIFNTHRKSPDIKNDKKSEVKNNKDFYEENLLKERNEREKLENDIKNLNSELSEIKNLVSELQKIKTENEKMLENKEKENNEIKNEISEMKVKAKELEENLEKMKNEISDKNTIIENYKKELENLKSDQNSEFQKEHEKGSILAEKCEKLLKEVDELRPIREKYAEIEKINLSQKTEYFHILGLFFY